ncbi:MAG: hypothetical protein ACLRIT_01440 [Blautia sp.]
MSSDASGFDLAKINPLRYRGYYTIRRRDCTICRQDTTTRR